MTTEWKIDDRAADPLPASEPARHVVGLWGNHGYEAAYAMVYVDARRRPAERRARAIELRFDAAAARRRLLVGDDVRHAGVLPRREPDRPLLDRRPHPRAAYGDDGSLTIFMQTDEPARPRRARQLAADPAGDFRPILRMYEPRPEVFDGSFELPPIVRRG